MWGALVSAAFEKVDEAGEIGVGVGVWVGEGVANAGLSGEVDHAVEGLLVEEPFHCGAVFERKLLKLEFGTGLELCEAIEFELDGIVGIEVIDTDYGVAALEQFLGGVHADEACCAGDEDVCHVG
ncbi:MAG: hypothetical protein RL215_2962 [Planctomycetota bacterium]